MYNYFYYNLQQQNCNLHKTSRQKILTKNIGTA